MLELVWLLQQRRGVIVDGDEHGAPEPAFGTERHPDRELRDHLRCPRRVEHPLDRIPNHSQLGGAMKHRRAFWVGFAALALVAGLAQNASAHHEAWILK